MDYQKLYEQALYEIESAVCSICAAGVPLSKIWIGRPGVVFNEKNYSYEFTVNWGVRK